MPIWTACPICGAVVEDNAMHALWHVTLAVQTESEGT